MKKFFYFFVGCFLLYYNTIIAQISPKEKSVVNCTSIYFQEENIVDASNYEIFISKDSSFVKQISTKSKTTNKIPVFTIDDLQWGETYFWKINAFNSKRKCTATSKTHKFEIISLESKTFGTIELRVNPNIKGNFSKEYIALDHSRTIFDKTGKAVWKIPVITGVVDSICRTRDIKFTDDNTLTFLTDKDACEIDFEGNLLWKAPQPFVLNGNNIEYHHEFYKNKKGDYYVLGRYQAYRKVLDKISDEILNNQANVIVKNNEILCQTEISVILKFNKNGDLLWFWDSNDYLTDEDLNFKKFSYGFPNFSSHGNAFSINSDETFAYFGMRDFGRVVKIDMESKQVVAAYGQKYASGGVQYAVNKFAFQHDARITKNNSILILNNNDIKAGKISSIIELNNNNIKQSDKEILWEFDLNFDELNTGKAVSGGNVQELSNGNLLVCTGTLSSIIEITRSKKAVWNAFIFNKQKKDSVWQPFPHYRVCSIKQIVKKHFYVSAIEIDKGKLNFTIYNTGNIADNYYIKAIYKNGEIKKMEITNFIKPNQNIFYSFFDDGSIDSIQIISATNSFISKKLKLIR